MAVPAWEMASNAYSTWYRRPSGEKMVVCVAGERVLHGHCRPRALPRALCLAAPAVLVSAVAGAANLLGNRIFSTWCGLEENQARGG